MWLSSGAGFAGVSATSRAGQGRVRITLVDRHPYNTFQPLLYQVATAGLNAGDVTFLLRDSRPAQRRPVPTGERDRDGPRRHPGHLRRRPPARLRLSRPRHGITTNHFGIPGAAEYTMSMYTRAEALKVRDTIFGSLEIIASRTDPNTGGFTVVVAAAGRPASRWPATGRAEDGGDPLTYPELNPRRVHMVLVEMGERLLAPSTTAPAVRAQGADQARGRRPAEHRVSEVHADRVDFKDGSSMPVDLVIWAAGVSGTDVANGACRSAGPAGSRSTATCGCRAREHLRHRRRQHHRRQPLPQLAQPALRREARRPADRPPVPRSGDRAVPLLRQGHHGHHRPW